MKTVTGPMATHLDGETTSLCSCWKITRRDGSILGFTDLDIDILYSGVTYHAAIGYKRTAVETSDSFEVDNLTIEGILNSSFIAASDVRKGLYDFAEVEVFILNYKDLGMGKVILRTGWMGEVILNRKGTFSSEIRGLNQILNINIGDLYTTECDADLGSTRCGVNLATYTVSGTVTQIDLASKVFRASALPATSANYYNLGGLKFTSGANIGKLIEIKNHEESIRQFEMFLTFPFPILVGETFDVYPGCDKIVTTCFSKFNNAVNHRGEPYMPGIDKASSYANSLGQ